MRIKICGITQAEQGQHIIQLGATALGFICVPRSPRYVSPEPLRSLLSQISTSVDRIGVFADADLATIQEIVNQTGLTGVQLHGQESPEFCQQVCQALPQVELIKAFRIRDPRDFAQIPLFAASVDTFLLDAYHPGQLGGTGQTLDWTMLQAVQLPRSWFLAGGLKPENIQKALAQVQPDGIDLSSGVEHSPGDKDLHLVAQLFAQLNLPPLKTEQTPSALPKPSLPAQFRQ